MDIDGVNRYRAVVFHAATMTPGVPATDDALIAALEHQEDIEGAVLDPATGEMVPPTSVGPHAALVAAAAATQRHNA